MNNNKRFLLFMTHVIFMMTLHAARAQSAQHFHEIIYMKDGTVLKGIITEHSPDSSIKVKTDDRKELVLKTSDVQKIVKEFYDIKRKGYFNITEAVFGIGSNDVSYGISTVNGFIVKPHFSLGVGAAFDYYANAGGMVPIYADARITFHDRRFTPFLYGDLGYSFAAFTNNFDNLSGGLFINPGIGLKSYIGKTTALLMSAGVRVQGLQYHVTDPVFNNGSQISDYYTMAVFRVGIRF